MSSVIVLDGGNSDERTVSLRSGAAVAAALRQAGHQVQELDTAEGLDGARLQVADVVFPVLHGVGGEDGSIQQRLEDLRVRYVGSGVAASRLCFDKWQYKRVLGQHNLPTPDAELVSAASIKDSPFIKQPFVLKPNDGGSSVDTFIIRDVAAIDWIDLQATLERYGKMLIETLIPGAEITIGILGDTALPVIEIIPPTSGEFDYENKYNGKSQELCPPEHVSQELQTKAQALALEAHRVCGCRDFSRTDIMISADGKLYILETNTIPGMTNQSLFPKAGQVSGLEMPALVDKLVGFALGRQS